MVRPVVFIVAELTVHCGTGWNNYLRARSYRRSLIIIGISGDKRKISFEPGSNQRPRDSAEARFANYSPTLFQLSYRRLHGGCRSTYIKLWALKLSDEPQ